MREDILAFLEAMKDMTNIFQDSIEDLLALNKVIDEVDL